MEIQPFHFFLDNTHCTTFLQLLSVCTSRSKSSKPQHDTIVGWRCDSNIAATYTYVIRSFGLNCFHRPVAPPAPLLWPSTCRMRARHLLLFWRPAVLLAALCLSLAVWWQHDTQVTTSPRPRSLGFLATNHP